MLSAEQNARLTRVGLATPGGRLLRHYWQPAALSEELGPERPLKALTLLGQDLVLFRDDQGRLGLIDRPCPHRGVDLAFGRLEHGGLRCPFHGWLFDVEGRCLETPAEPEGSSLCTRIRQPAYAVAEKNGVIFAWLGQGTPPAFPDFDCFLAPDAYSFAFKGHFDCNWLQALEVGIDPAHASFLHRFFADEDPAQGYGKQFRAPSADSDLPMSRLMREHVRPDIEVEPTDYGLRLYARRHIDERRTHFRVTNLVFPQAFVIPMSPEMIITQWHVPIDDESCYWYAMFTSFTTPVDKQAMRQQRLELYTLPDYRPRKNRANNWGYDAAEQRSQTYTGMGADINVHDQWAVESQGRIQDRTREHLGTTDKAIIANRRLLAQAIELAERGERPPMVLDGAAARRLTGPATVDGIAPRQELDRYWREFDTQRRRQCRWAAAAA